MKKIYILFVLALIITLTNCSSEKLSRRNSNNKILEEVEVIEIPLTGKIAERKSEISGLCWYNDNLILLPQYPDRFSENGLGKIFYIKKNQIDDFLSGKNSSPLNAEFLTIDLQSLSKYFQIGSGFEAITTNFDTIYFSIESLNKGETETILIMGIIDFNQKRIVLDNSSLTLVNSKLHISNLSDETILFYKNKIIPIYEANGSLINSKPRVSVFNNHLGLIKEIDFPNIEYRITDATSADKNGKFWVINYLYPGDYDKLKVGEDFLVKKYGIGKSNKKSKAIERLVELQYSQNKIEIVDRLPIYLTMLKSDSRNWEGLVRYNGVNNGFLLATDTFPKTILGFVKAPGSDKN